MRTKNVTLVRCGVCGGKMYFCKRYNLQDQDYFTCGTHKNKPDECKSSNIIRSPILEACVSESIKSMIDYVLSHQSDFIKEITEKGKNELDFELKKKQKIVTKNKSRIDKIDTIIKQLYIDKLEGNLSDDRFRKMTDDFEAEQAVLKKETDTLESEIAIAKDKEIDVKKFISLIKKYRDSDSLTPTLLNDLIDHIDVYPKNKATRTREITIHYKFVGPFTPKS